MDKPILKDLTIVNVPADAQSAVMEAVVNVINRFYDGYAKVQITSGSSSEKDAFRTSNSSLLPSL